MFFFLPLFILKYPHINRQIAQKLFPYLSLYLLLAVVQIPALSLIFFLTSLSISGFAETAKLETRTFLMFPREIDFLTASTVLRGNPAVLCKAFLFNLCRLLDMVEDTA